MRRALLLAVVGAVLVVAFAGVAFAAVIQCDTATDRDPDPGQCAGTNNPDQITGTAGADQILALGGNDGVPGDDLTGVEARGGDDVLDGGPGNDALVGETGNDTYFGNRGTDFLSDGGDAFDGVFSPNVSADQMDGGANTDFIEGDAGNDTLLGKAGDEQNFFAGVQVAMFGDEGNDTLNGGDGNDAMEGEQGLDVHRGNAGNDFIDAANEDTGEVDVVNCGSGFDTAVVLHNDDVSNNCEDVGPPTVAASGTTDEEQQQLREAFLAGRGG
jgi:Ca2+-binding RTX toxin-like protein